MKLIIRLTALMLGIFWSTASLFAAEALAPSGLMTDLLEHTDRVFHNGLPTNLTLQEMSTAIETLQYPEVLSQKPTFTWIVNDRRNNVLQTAYEIEVASNPNLFDSKKEPDCWRSGRVAGAQSVAVRYAGKSLQASTVYYWRVRTWNNEESSPWSAIKSFKTGSTLSEFAISRYPTVKRIELPQTTKRINPNLTFYDFGKAAFGLVRVRIKSGAGDQEATIRLGERILDGRVNRKPAGSTRFAEYKLKLMPGEMTYFVKTRVDKRNSSGAAFLAPPYIGEVMPFRYAEVELEDPKSAEVTGFERDAVQYVFNENASSFRSDNEILNRVWELCRYSIKATAFLGVFIDGDRERIPYEGDAVLNQLSYYSVDREYSAARYTQNYLITHPTWPTEWILQSVHMAWYDYLYTGDSRNIANLYRELKAKSLITLAEENGLISTRKGKLTQEVIDSVHFKSPPKLRDIVDWPHKGLAGNENADSGETDGFVFCDFNVVVNSYYYFGLRSMQKFAEILGKKEDAILFERLAKKMYTEFQTLFFDAQRGVYRDGESTEHASLHGNMFPLAFGLVPQEHKDSVMKFVKSRGMKCSVYGAQFLLDSIYEANDAEYGLERMTAKDLRGWFNMLQVGTTITLEAWDDRYKPNQDWNHAWGAAPANIIPRHLVGVLPIKPGFEKIRIKPQIANLKEVHAVVPTIRGSVTVDISRKNETFAIDLTIPANMTAEVWLPNAKTITLNGRPLELKRRTDGNFAVLDSVGSGKWHFQTR